MGLISASFRRRFRDSILLQFGGGFGTHFGADSERLKYPGKQQEGTRNLRRSFSQPGKLPLHAPEVNLFSKKMPAPPPRNLGIWELGNFPEFLEGVPEFCNAWDPGTFRNSRVPKSRNSRRDTGTPASSGIPVSSPEIPSDRGFRNVPKFPNPQDSRTRERRQRTRELFRSSRVPEF